MTADEWREFLEADSTLVAADGKWFSYERPPDVPEPINEHALPRTVSEAEAWFERRGAKLEVTLLGDQAYADVTHPEAGRLGSYVIGVDADADAVAAEAAARWLRQTTRNR